MITWTGCYRLPQKNYFLQSDQSVTFWGVQNIYKVSCYSIKDKLYNREPTTNLEKLNFLLRESLCKFINHFFSYIILILFEHTDKPRYMKGRYHIDQAIMENMCSTSWKETSIAKSFISHTLILRHEERKKKQL